jgi:UDP-2,3-diacylglucosamine hydrolase
LTARVLLVSDLHLEEQRQDITDAFVKFLQANRGNCSALYILGDLFEVWIGDDVESSLATTIANSLHDFSEGGSAVYLMHGNRDFLLGDVFAEKCGASLIQDPHLLEEQNLEVLLLHGDSLCTDDVDYQQFRTMVRDSLWQSEFLGKSIEDRIAYAKEARKQSQAATGNKSMEIMDVNQSAVKALFHSAGQRLIIHGHTHRPAIHEISLEKNANREAMGKRTVLGDWDKAIWFAEIKNGEIALHTLPFA